jgi:TRAP-type uncharacterized transport system substrate-binding protein
MASAAAEIESLLGRVLAYVQSRRALRVGLGLVLIGALLALAARSVYGILPRHYTLTVSGGGIVTNRHFLARILQAEAPKAGVTLIVQPEEGNLALLQKVSEGKIDLAFIQGGLATVFPNVEHVATVGTEMVHLLVRRGIKGMGDLRGRSINLGAKDSGERDVGLTITQYAGYAENVDYVETNFTPEQLLALPAARMPDAIVAVSSVPSYLAELLVRERGYDVVEIPFPEALALRHGWAADGRILSYTYDLSPPVPSTNIQTVAVNLHLVANAKANPAAIEKILEVLYSPSVANKLRQPIDESRIAVSSGYPVSAGMTAYVNRNGSVFTLEMWNRLAGMFGLAMSFGGMGIVVLKWFRGPQPEPAYHDAEFQRWMLDVAVAERSAFAMEASGSVDVAEIKRMRDTLAVLRTELLEKQGTAVLKDPLLYDRCLASVRAAHEYLGNLVARERS